MQRTLSLTGMRTRLQLLFVTMVVRTYLPNSLNPSCSLSLCRPEPHILLFRRPLGTDPQSGRVDPELARQARDEYKNQMGLRK